MARFPIQRSAPWLCVFTSRSQRDIHMVYLVKVRVRWEKEKNNQMQRKYKLKTLNSVSKLPLHIALEVQLNIHFLFFCHETNLERTYIHTSTNIYLVHEKKCKVNTTIVSHSGETFQHGRFIIRVNVILFVIFFLSCWWWWALCTEYHVWCSSVLLVCSRSIVVWCSHLYFDVMLAICRLQLM